MWWQPPRFSMLTPHCGHAFAPIFRMAFSDSLSSCRFTLLQEPECHGRVQTRQMSWSQCGQVALSPSVFFFLASVFDLSSVPDVLCLLPQSSMENWTPHFGFRQAMYDGSAAMRCLVIAVSQLCMLAFV